jgi:adenylate cyclase
MSRAVTDHRGHVSKFLGDGLLALFGALEPDPWQANDAAHAALAMQDAVGDYNRELAADGLPVLRLSIGIHRGVVVAGLVGGDALMEFTVIGRHVNLAARVEQLTWTYGVGVLVTRDVQRLLDPRFVVRELPAAAVKGVSEPVVPFAVEGFRE